VDKWVCTVCSYVYDPAVGSVFKDNNKYLTLQTKDFKSDIFLLLYLISP
jgi:hypothetical protein